MNKSLLDASCRVAFAALLHDLGKFAERAGLPVSNKNLDAHKQLYAKLRTDGGSQFWYTHQHAAYTGIGWDQLEKFFPAVLGTSEAVFPFAAWKTLDVDDSLVNAAAKHHIPSTFLQHVVAAADRIASGFEREVLTTSTTNNRSISGTGVERASRIRLQTLFEQISLQLEGDSEDSQDAQGKNQQYHYPLEPTSVKAIFPQEGDGVPSKEDAKLQYHQLWEQFKSALESIPPEHKQSWPLWLDHFDSAWAAYTQAIPAATYHVQPDVSLYDHSHTTAALAVAMWRYYHDNKVDVSAITGRISDSRHQSWDEEQFLLIQGDFFGIQGFLLSSGSSTQKKAARLLRGRSFYVSLLTECAALRILDDLALPPTSQVINAAGRFLIVAPNSRKVRQKLVTIQRELDEWFLKHTYGTSGIGIATTAACARDFCAPGHSAMAGEHPFSKLMTRVFDQLQIVKAQRFGLCRQSVGQSDGGEGKTHWAPPAPVFGGFLEDVKLGGGVCAIDGRSPASPACRGLFEEPDIKVSQLAADQIKVGELLIKTDLVLLAPAQGDRSGGDVKKNKLEMPIFGYQVRFANVGECEGSYEWSRVWDLRLPEEEDECLFQGFARRQVNGYVPRFSETDQYALTEGKYDSLSPEDRKLDMGNIKTLEHLACEDLRLDEHGVWRGVEALVTIKGDVDDLGLIFEKGMGRPSFARHASLSRQINGFFSTWLPWYCSKEYSNVYTVFAGGDDFFLIGPWRSSMDLVRRMRQEFANYVAGNDQVHFSAGLSMTKPGMPIRQMHDRAEDALEESKGYTGTGKRVLKDALTVFGLTVSWSEYDWLMKYEQELIELSRELNLSTGYLYSLFELADMAEDLRSPQSANPRNAIWRSKLTYRTARMIRDKRAERERDGGSELQAKLIEKLVQLLGVGGNKARIPLFRMLYQNRN